MLKPQGFFRLSKIGQDKKEPHPFIAGCGRWSESFEAAKSACGQCPHFGLRIGSYMGRIGPDSACFRGRPVFARAGMQFESHLGHVFSLFRGLWASECGQILTCGPLRGPFCWPVLGPGGSSSDLSSGVAGYLFMDGSVRNCMTWLKAGERLDDLVDCSEFMVGCLRGDMTRAVFLTCFAKGW